MISADVIGALANEFFPFLVGWCVMAARFMGLALAFPMFSWVNLPMSVRFAFAAAMSAPMAYVFAYGNESEITALAAWQVASLGVKEFLIGYVTGLVAGIPFWMAQSAGEIIDTYRGSSAGALFDPALTTETSEIGAAFIMVALAIFVWSGGLVSLVGVVYASYVVWEPLSFFPEVTKGNALALGAAAGAMLQSALAMAAPALIFLFAIDLALALATRSTRQFQVFELNLTIKNTAFVFFMPVIAGALAVAMSREISRIPALLDTLKAILP